MAVSGVADTAVLTARPGLWARLSTGRTLPLLIVLGAILLAWYAGAIGLNADRATQQLGRISDDWSTLDLVGTALALDRPVLPTPDQVTGELWASTVEVSVTSRRSLLYHAWVTMASTLLGFALGTGLGMLLAIGIVYARTLDRSLMPWIIASQTIPILAIAPMIVVVLGNLGLTGTGPKAVISAYLSFFPVAIGMVKGLRAPDPMQLDLMHTYSATRPQVFAKLRWPSAVPFLFPSLKVGIALSLVGAIVGELPTGAQAGIGARLLLGSYYGQMVNLWAALFVAAAMALVSIGVITAAERLVVRSRGGGA